MVTLGKQYVLSLSFLACEMGMAAYVTWYYEEKVK